MKLHERVYKKSHAIVKGNTLAYFANDVLQSVTMEKTFGDGFYTVVYFIQEENNVPLLTVVKKVSE